MLSRISQIQKDRYCIIALCEILRRVEIIEIKSDWWLPEVWRKRERRVVV